MNRFKLPLEGLILTQDILNRFSSFRRPEKPYLKVRRRNIGYQNEVMVLGVSIADEPEEKVYLHIHLDYLLIACSVDTDKNYLSRYAYFALDELLSCRKYFNFERFYWPGFFNAKTGRSKYLNIINDRQGMDVYLKPKYSPFFRPGQRLYYPSSNFQAVPRPKIAPVMTTLFSEQGTSIGYCLANAYQKAFHSNHWPCLVPYTLLPTRRGEKVKSFIAFAKQEAALPVLDYPPAQTELNSLCYQMMALAPIAAASRSHTDTESEQIHYGNLRKRDELFLLWQKALPALLSQQYTHHTNSQGMANIKGKPNRVYMKACTFCAEVPGLCFSWRDKGEYFELKMLFKVGKKVRKPVLLNTAFFISSIDEPMRFYLLNSLQDLYVMGMFLSYKNCMSVLKSHYEEHFKTFKEQLGKVYEFVKQR